MQVQVLLFAGLADTLGKDSLELTLPAGATVADLRSAAIDLLPALRGASFRVAVDAVYANDDAALVESGELAFIPPVSGG